VESIEFGDGNIELACVETNVPLDLVAARRPA